MQTSTAARKIEKYNLPANERTTLQTQLPAKYIQIYNTRALYTLKNRTSFTLTGNSGFPCTDRRSLKANA